MKRAVVLAVFFLASSSFAQTHQHGSMPAGDGNFNPFVVADGRGGFYVAYIERKDAASNVTIKHSTDGVNFSAPVRVNDKPGDAAVRNENPPKVAVASTGEVYVCWANEREKWKGDIRFARSTDGGKSFSKAITINSDAASKPAGHAFQSVAIDRSGRIYAAWIDERHKQLNDRGAQIWMATSDDHGKSFSPDRRIISDVCECCRTNIQIADDGTLFLSYRTVPAHGPMYRDIVLARSTDRGSSFTTWRVSEDGWAIDACPVTGPALSLGAGRVAVIWFTGGGSRPGLYYAVSTNNGETFTQARLLDDKQRLAKHAQAVSLKNGQIVVAWDDAIEGVTTFAGLLDPEAGGFTKSINADDVFYPSLATSGNMLVIVGMKRGSNDISFIRAPLPERP